jgi:hypothetical protein
LRLRRNIPNNLEIPRQRTVQTLGMTKVSLVVVGLWPFFASSDDKFEIKMLREPWAARQEMNRAQVHGENLKVKSKFVT